MTRPASAATSRLCTRCERTLPLSAFGTNRRMRDGLSSWCRQCAADRTRQWRAEVRDEYNARRRVHKPERPCEGCGLPIIGRIDKRFCCRACRDYHLEPGDPMAAAWAAAHRGRHEARGVPS